MSENLKPCRFCGGTNMSKPLMGGVRCETCGAFHPRRKMWNTRHREAELEAKCQELGNWRRSASDLLMADKFKIDQLQARVKLLEGLLHNAYPKVGPELAIAILEALRHETSEEVK